MMFPKTKQNRFQLSFRQKKVFIHLPMEEFLKKDLHITCRNKAYKVALKHSYKKPNHLELASKMFIFRPFITRRSYEQQSKEDKEHTTVGETDRGHLASNG